MNKTKTALTQLIEKIDKGMSALGDSDVARAMESALEVYRDESISLLQKEREDMQATFIAGAKSYYNRDFNIKEVEQDAKSHFTQTFTQYKEHE